MPRSPAIGIDLGTTYCCVSVFRDGDDEPQIIPNDLGKNTTPSYVAYDDDGIVVGETAKNQAFENPQNTIFDVKRLMGREFHDPSVQNDAKLWPFDIVHDDEDSLLKVKANGRAVLPQDVSKELLIYLKKTAEDFLGCPVHSAVVTVPAYFNDLQRRLTIEACEKAGLHILQLVSEPTAASVAYSLHTQAGGAKTQTSLDERNCLIFDLGGGTFDVAVLTIISRNFIRIKGLGGDARLGGEDFDNIMCDYCIKIFQELNGVNLAEGKNSEDSGIKLKVSRRLRRIKKECEKQKCFLSEARSVVVSLVAIHGEIDLVVTFTRPLFEQLIEEYLQRCMTVVEHTLEESGMRKEQIHDVVLIGGSSRIPKTQKMLKDYFGMDTLIKSINPDEAVACGAAIQAYYSQNHDLAGIVIEEPKIKHTHTQVWTSDSSYGSFVHDHDFPQDSTSSENLDCDLEESSSSDDEITTIPRKHSIAPSSMSIPDSPALTSTSSTSPSPTLTRSISEGPNGKTQRRIAGLIRSVTQGQLNVSQLPSVIETGLQICMCFDESCVRIENLTDNKSPGSSSPSPSLPHPVLIESVSPAIAFTDKIRIGKSAEKFKGQEGFYNILELITKERNRICQLSNSTKDVCILFEEEIIGAFLQVIKERVEKTAKGGQGATVTHIVFTFPFVCTRVQKERIKIAATLAGIESIRIFSNLTLTAISYANFRKSLLSLTNNFDSINYLIIQYGPGFFSSALMEHTPNLVRVKAFYSSYLLNYEDKAQFLKAHAQLLLDQENEKLNCNTGNDKEGADPMEDIMEIHMSILNKTCSPEERTQVDASFVITDTPSKLLEDFMKKNFWTGTSYSFNSKSGPLTGAAILHSKTYSLGGTRIYDAYPAEFKCTSMNAVKVKSMIFKELNHSIIVAPNNGEVFRHFIEIDFTLPSVGNSFTFSLEELLHDRFYSEICSYRLSITINKSSKKTIKKYVATLICVQDDDGVCHLEVETPPSSIADAIKIEFFRTDKLNSELKNISNRKSSFNNFYKNFHKKRWGLSGWGKH